jgi:hypothetical protein
MFGVRDQGVKNMGFGFDPEFADEQDRFPRDPP